MLLRCVRSYKRPLVHFIFTKKGVQNLFGVVFNYIFKVVHWDEEIRLLAAEALRRLCLFDPYFISVQVILGCRFFETL